MKILMVCLGNICRSPMAEGVMKKLILENDLRDWSVDSAGVGDWHIGELPDRRAIRCARNHGIDITDQRAKHLHQNDIERYDHILVMDHTNYMDVIALNQNSRLHHKVKLILEGCEAFLHHHINTMRSDLSMGGK